MHEKDYFILIAMVALQLAVPAQETNLTFMYINGSNNNDKK